MVSWVHAGVSRKEWFSSDARNMSQYCWDPEDRTSNLGNVTTLNPKPVQMTLKIGSSFSLVTSRQNFLRSIELPRGSKLKEIH